MQAFSPIRRRLRRWREIIEPVTTGIRRLCQGKAEGRTGRSWSNCKCLNRQHAGCIQLWVRFPLCGIAAGKSRAGFRRLAAAVARVGDCLAYVSGLQVGAGLLAAVGAWSCRRLRLERSRWATPVRGASLLFRTGQPGRPTRVNRCHERTYGGYNRTAPRKKSQKYKWPAIPGGCSVQLWSRWYSLRSSGLPLARNNTVR